MVFNKEQTQDCYPTMDSADRPVKHGEELLIPIPPDDGVDVVDHHDTDGAECAIGGVPGQSYRYGLHTGRLKFRAKAINSMNLNGLVRDLHCLKRKHKTIYMTKMCMSLTTESRILI